MQKLIDTCGISLPPIGLPDLKDVELDVLLEDDILLYDFDTKTWNNWHFDQLLEKIRCSTLIVDISFNAECCTNYIVDVSQWPVTANLPENPELGCTIFFIDRKAVGTPTEACTIGFGSNHLRLLPPEGHNVEGRDEFIVNADNAYIEIFYIGCETWRIINYSEELKAGLVSIYVDGGYVAQTTQIDFLSGRNINVSGTETVFGVDGSQKVEVQLNSSSVIYLDDLLDVSANSFTLLGERYLKFDPVIKIWQAPLIDFVLDVNGQTGSVALTTDQIPETFDNKYLNRERFLAECNVTSLDAFGDVFYDRTLRNGDVLVASGGVFVPRSPLISLRLDNLTDTEFVYNTSFYNGSYRVPDDWDRPFYDNYMLSLRLNDDVDLARGDGFWKPNFLHQLLGRERLGHLMDVNVPLTSPNTSERQDPNDPESPFKQNTMHGKALMFNADTGNWEPGGYVELRTSDDLQQGAFNLYLSTSTLPNILRQCIYISDLLGVDIPDMGGNAIFETSKVLSYDPISNNWVAAEALTDTATTSDIPEPPFVPSGITSTTIPVTSATQRVYLTKTRLDYYVNQFLHLDDLRDVNVELHWSGFNQNQDALDVEHGMSLVWDDVEQKWHANYPTSAINTDYLPEGSENLYYTDLRVSNWTISNIRNVGLNYFTEVALDGTNDREDGESIVWDAEQNRWTNAYAVPFRLNRTGDLIVGKPGYPPFDYIVQSLGSDGQFLRVNPSSPTGMSWEPRDPLYGLQVQLPDVPLRPFANAKDKAGIVFYLGTDFDNAPDTDYVNPTLSEEYIFIYHRTNGNKINFLTDRTYYNTINNDELNYEVDSNVAFNLNMADGPLVIDFKQAFKCRPFGFLVQADPGGELYFGLYVSHNGVNWSQINVVELSSRMKAASDVLGKTTFGNPLYPSRTVASGPDLAGKHFYYLPTGLTETNFSDPDPDLNYFRYLKIEKVIGETTCLLYELEIYGLYNNGINYHFLLPKDRDKYLLSAVNQLEIALPVINFDVANLGEGFQCYVVPKQNHRVKIYLAGTGQGEGRITTNVSDSNQITDANPIELDEGTTAKIVFLGRYIDEESFNNSAYSWWQVTVFAPPGTGDGGGGLPGDITVDVNDVENIGSVAITNNYSSLDGLPTFATVAGTGEYTDLLNRPTLGTASTYNVGLQAGNLIELITTGEGPGLPAIDGSNLLNLSVESEPDLPLIAKGDLLVHSGAGLARLAPSTDNLVLTLDSNETLGVAWRSISLAGAEASSLKVNPTDVEGEPGSFYLNLANATGVLSATVIDNSGGRFADIAFSGSITDIVDVTIGSAIGYNAGSGAGDVVEILNFGTQTNPIPGLPALDARNLYNVAQFSLLDTKGDMFVRATGGLSKIELPRNLNGDILEGYLLMTDTNPANTKGIQWIDINAVVDNAGGDGDGGGALATASFLKLTSGSVSGFQGTYYLDRANHIGVMPYTDLDSFSYLNLTDTPNLGTAAFENIIDPNNPTQNPQYKVLQLDGLGRIPAVDGSQITNLALDSLPVTSKGQLITHNGNFTVVINPGPDGQYLQADSSVAEGVRWASLTVSDAATLNGLAPSYYLSLINATDTLDIARVSGTGNAVFFNAGTAPNEVLRIGPDGKLPTIDGSNLTGIIPLASKGEILSHDGADLSVLPQGNTGQVLVADSATTSGLRWEDQSNITGPGQGLTTILSVTSYSVSANTLNLIDTTAGPMSATLPFNPPNGTKVTFADYASNFDVHALTILPSSTNTIQDKTSLTLSTKYATIQLVFFNDRWVLYGTNAFVDFR